MGMQYINTHIRDGGGSKKRGNAARIGAIRVCRNEGKRNMNQCLMTRRKIAVITTKVGGVWNMRWMEDASVVQ